MNYKFVVRAFFLLEVIVLLVRIILIQEGFLDVSYMYTDKTERGISYDLGYGNPNTPGITIFVMLCCLYILTYERFRWLSFIGIALISVITFDYTASRTTFYCEILLLLTYFVPRGFLKRYIYNKILLGLIPILLVAFIFMGEYLSDFNTLTSGRISNMYILMGMFSSPLTFLTGLQSDMVGDVDFPIDNGIAYMLCVGGIIAVGLFLIRYYSWVKEKDMIPTVLLSVIIVMLISGVGEKTIANFGVSGGSLFWMLLFNNSYRKMIVKM